MGGQQQQQQQHAWANKDVKHAYGTYSTPKNLRKKTRKTMNLFEEKHSIILLIGEYLIDWQVVHGL